MFIEKLINLVYKCDQIYWLFNETKKNILIINMTRENKIK